MAQNTHEYYSALLVKDLIIYQQSGIMLDDGLLVMCEESQACIQEPVSSENASLNYESFTFTENVDSSIDLFLSTAVDVVNGNENIFGNGSPEERSELRYEIGHYYNSDQESIHLPSLERMKELKDISPNRALSMIIYHGN